MKSTKVLKVVALLTSVGLMGAYVGHRALQASPKAAPPPAPAAEAPKQPPEMFAGSKSEIDIVTVDDVKEILPAPAPERPKISPEMMSGSKSLIHVITPEDVAKPEAPPAPKAQQRAK